MLVNLYNKRNGQRVSVLYPKHGTSNILRRVEGVKKASFTGPSGKGITVVEDNGQVRGLSLSKVVVR